jgi:DNA-binding response OmpR family regulator
LRHMPPFPPLQVLVVEDEPTNNDLVCLWLKSMRVPNFEPVPVLSFTAACKALSSQKFDLAVLDRVLEDGNGIELLRRIRAGAETENLPVVILSGMFREPEVIHGLNRGADDYLVKPCTQELFSARILAVLRRNRERASSLVRGPGFELDPTDGRLSVDGRSEHLEPKEAELLLVLLRRPNVVHSAVDLRRAVWGGKRIPHHTLESRLSSLRRKLGARADCLQTIRGIGYRLLN